MLQITRIRPVPVLRTAHRAATVALPVASRSLSQLPSQQHRQHVRLPSVLLPSQSSRLALSSFQCVRCMSNVSPPHGPPNGATSPKDVGVLLSAASAGDIPSMKDVLALKTCTVNDGDYDRRRPLHLASAEGRVEAVKFLLSQGAQVNAEDRWGYTALDDAVTGRHDDVISILRAAGGNIGHTRMADMGNTLCQAAAEGNVQHLQRLVNCGVDVNKGDYDSRTPLHVAAGEGRASTVEFLLKNGANVNSVDRFGNTPLRDASRSHNKHKHVVMNLLLTHGAQLESSDWQIKYDPLLQGSLLRSLPFLLQRSGSVYIEAWLPNEDEREFQLIDSATPSQTKDKSVANISKFIAAPPDPNYANSPSNRMGKAWSTKEPIVIHDLTEKDLPTRYQVAKESGLKSGLIIPVSYNDKPFALLKLFSLHNPKLTPEELHHFTQFASGIIVAGMQKQGKYPAFALTPATAGYKTQMIDVYQQIVDEEVFNANLVYHEVDWFYNLGLQKYYFERFAATEIANHIHAFIAAKKVAATTGHNEEIFLNIEGMSVDHSPTWLYMCPIEHDKQVEVEKRIQNQIMKIASPAQNKSYTLEFFMSQKPILPGGQKQMGLYVLESSEWSNPSKLGKATESHIEDIASVTFLRTKTPQIRERYQEELSATVQKISPVTHVFPTYRDGTTPIMFSFYHAAGTTTSYMLQLTELLKGNGLIANRKFIETFANGVIVYSLYLQPAPQQQKSIDSLLTQFSMLHLVPESTLTAKFLSGEYTAQQYTYYSAASRFVYYFLKGRSEEFDVLAKSLKNDPLNLGRLRLLQTRLKREAVSQERIYHCITHHPNVTTELFNDFYKVATTPDPVKLSGQLPPPSPDVITRIKHEAATPLDQSILTALLSFNTHLLKTNFYNKQKAALSFRLDPRFLADGDWPTVPFALFFIMGSDFQGFHLRFSDVARGGIRVIKSGDRQAYNNNLETLFSENYGLAYTQNKKNKDIPEFGSKGTILLNLTNQTNPFLAFQKYTSGLLDLIVVDDVKEIVDNYGKEEILFLGPDEGTADYMEWAALYAQKRGYPYWRSFTTGKPVSLGGIPHDKYGMTTRSVHRYVLGCLKKCNLDEGAVTKFQTGGPDGDLGSNEILLSHDKTIAICDGSGVIYDPQGLNRQELVRLATKRVMIKEFNLQHLSKGGFRVLVGDSNITLPNGERIDSGLAFRNEFHLHELSTADLFVPCGGRPESVNLSNVNKLFDTKGKPRFKIIVEGANLFFTQDARMVLENAGVILYKDASANKGGVTSSSLEVLAALAMPNTLFEQHMCVKDGFSAIPAFYSEYVKEIQQRIEADAALEFNCIWKENQRSGIHRYLLTDQVSDKINSLNDFIQKSSLWLNVDLRHTVLSHAIPKKLIHLLGLEAIVEKVPDQYIQAIFGAYLASRYVYKHGLDANEMAFFEFMQPYLTETLNRKNAPLPLKPPTPPQQQTITATQQPTQPPTPQSSQQQTQQQAQQQPPVQQKQEAVVFGNTQSGSTTSTSSTTTSTSKKHSKKEKDSSSVPSADVISESLREGKGAEMQAKSGK